MDGRISIRLFNKDFRLYVNTKILCGSQQIFTRSDSTIETLEEHMSEICSKLTIKILEHPLSKDTSCLLFQFEHVYHLFQVLLLFTSSLYVTEYFYRSLKLLSTEVAFQRCFLK